MRLLALLACLVLLAGPAAAQRPCSQYKAAITSVPVAAPVQRVPGIPGKRIYLCGWVLVPTPPSSGTNQVEFEITSGTGTDCATGPHHAHPADVCAGRRPH